MLLSFNIYISEKGTLIHPYYLHHTIAISLQLISFEVCLSYYIPKTVLSIFYIMLHNLHCNTEDQKLIPCAQTHTARKKKNLDWNWGVFEFKLFPFIQARGLNERMHIKPLWSRQVYRISAMLNVPWLKMLWGCQDKGGSRKRHSDTQFLHFL